MIKLVTFLTVVTLLWATFLVKRDSPQLVTSSVEKDSIETPTVSVTPATLGLATDSSVLETSQLYHDKKLGFDIRYPQDVTLKVQKDGSLTLTQGPLNILISSFPITPKDTLNTLAEAEIDGKQLLLQEKFTLVDLISPIAIGSQTGITFRTQESGQEITYFYLSHGNNYLKITNKTTDIPGKNLISLSDDIIYSLTLTDK